MASKGIDDRWYMVDKTAGEKVKTARHGKGSRWRARYRDDNGVEHAAHRATKTAAQAWLDEQTSKLVTGTHVAPRLAKTAVGEWCDMWLEGYRTRKPSTGSEKAPTDHPRGGPDDREFRGTAA